MRSDRSIKWMLMGIVALSAENSVCTTFELGQKETACVGVMCVAVVAMSFLLGKRFGLRHSIEHERIADEYVVARDETVEVAGDADAHAQKTSWARMIARKVATGVVMGTVFTCSVRAHTGPVPHPCAYLALVVIGGLSSTINHELCMLVEHRLVGQIM